LERSRSRLARAVVVAALLGCLLLPTRAALACIWDRDTLAAEAKGLPDTVAVVTGRFDRNPPLYYEMRLARVAAEIEKTPGNLALYDDAAVACDRLGRSADAIAWMEAKRGALERAPAGKGTTEHRYRYLANAGTFWAHRWIHDGADRRRLEMVRKARELIAKAIKLNPDAHFGRERYQLRALDWILSPPKVDAEATLLPNFLDLDLYPTIKDRGVLKSEGISDAVAGVSGLIVLGNAWESVDVYLALAAALQAEGRSSLAYLAHLRAEELVNAGRRSLHPKAPQGESLRDWLGGVHYPIQHKEPLDAEFKRLRQEADGRNRARTDFMVARLEDGRHPDTDPSFWAGYQEPPAPRLSNLSTSPDVSTALRQLALAMAGLVAALIALLWAARRLWRRRRARLASQP